MRPKEIQEKLGIDAERIKLFKREGIFKPEHPPVGNKATDYTEADFKNLQRIVVLTWDVSGARPPVLNCKRKMNKM